jgi:hypothetical protein
MAKEFCFQLHFNSNSIQLKTHFHSQTFNINQKGKYRKYRYESTRLLQFFLFFIISYFLLS